MTDNTQELDRILNNYGLEIHHFKLYEPSAEWDAERHKAKQALLDWHHKQIEEVLDRLDKSMPADEQLTTKYGYHMPDKQYGYKLALHDIREVIAKLEAEL